MNFRSDGNHEGLLPMPQAYIRSFLRRPRRRQPRQPPSASFKAFRSNLLDRG